MRGRGNERVLSHNQLLCHRELTQTAEVEWNVAVERVVGHNREEWRQRRSGVVRGRLACLPLLSRGWRHVGSEEGLDDDTGQQEMNQGKLEEKHPRIFIKFSCQKCLTAEVYERCLREVKGTMEGRRIHSVAVLRSAAGAAGVVRYPFLM